MKKHLIDQLKSNSLIELRLAEFKHLSTLDTTHWFGELCFCILTANSKAQTALAIQAELGPQGFIQKTQAELADVIKKNRHRFHNNKAKYIVEARKFIDIKTHVLNLTGPQARVFITKNIKGLGFKEASHFLRNVGFDDVAIIDRHILRYLLQKNLISQIPSSISPQTYLQFEAILAEFGIPLSRLDLIIWEQMTGKVLK